MEGEDESSETEDSFGRKTVGERISVILAGPLMNFVLGFLCFFMIFVAIGVPSTQIDQIIPDSPAASVGLQEEDRVVRIQNEEINDWDQLVTRISEAEGRTITIEVLRNNETIQFEVTPEVDSETGRAMIGIVPGK